MFLHKAGSLMDLKNPPYTCELSSSSTERVFWSRDVAGFCFDSSRIINKCILSHVLLVSTALCQMNALPTPQTVWSSTNISIYFCGFTHSPPVWSGIHSAVINGWEWDRMTMIALWPGTHRNNWVSRSMGQNSTSVKLELRILNFDQFHSFR